MQNQSLAIGMIAALFTTAAAQASIVPANDVGVSVVASGLNLSTALTPQGGLACPGATAVTEAFSGTRTQDGRIFRDALPSTCAGKAYPGIFGTGTNFNYEQYAFNNTSASTACVTVNFDPDSPTSACATNAHASAYIGSYDPANQATNFVGDVGSSLAQPFSFQVPGNGTMVLVVSNTSAAAICNYAFQVVDLPCDTGTDLSLALSSSPTQVAPGGNVTYTATIDNNGPANANNVALTFTVPAGGSVASANASGGGSCTGTGPVTCTWPSIANGGSQTANIVITAPQTSGTLTASATVSADGTDPVTGNNSATATTGIAVPPPTFIPTATHYGLALLAAFLGLIGFAAFRRH